MITCLPKSMNEDIFDKFLIIKTQAGFKLLINSSNRMIDMTPKPNTIAA